jgi:SAM-dependent methyltransferase
MPLPFQNGSVPGLKGWLDGGRPGRWESIDASANPLGYLRFLEESRASDRDGSAGLLEHLGPLELEPGHAVLEVGCGTGLHLRPVAEAVGPEGRVVGLDNSLTLLIAARARVGESAPPVELQWGDACRMPFAEGAFDRCWCVSVFMHLADPEQALREMTRVTRAGGKIAAADVDWDTWIVDAGEPELTRRILGRANAHVRNPASGRALPGMMVRAGLAEIEVRAITRTFLGRWTAHRKRQMAILAHTAVREEAVTREEAARWLRDLRKRAAAGEFFEAKTLFCAFGRKVA